MVRLLFTGATASGSLGAGGRRRGAGRRGVRVVRVARDRILVRAHALPVATHIRVRVERSSSRGGRGVGRGRRRDGQAAGTEHRTTVGARSRNWRKERGSKGIASSSGVGKAMLSRGGRKSLPLHRGPVRLGGGGNSRGPRRGRGLDGEGLGLHTARGVRVLEDLALDLERVTTMEMVVLRFQLSALIRSVANDRVELTNRSIARSGTSARANSRKPKARTIWPACC